jgi:hypothetical protein
MLLSELSFQTTRFSQRQERVNVVFSFVAHDLTDKFILLDNLYKNDPMNYRTVQTMIEYEKNRNDKSGTIALLRLLRALEFTYLFLQRAIISTTESSNSKHIAWDVYKQTLHKRHHKAIRLSIWCATATIPKRETLKQILLHGEIEVNTSEKCFPIIENIYRDISRLYEQNNILELVQL